ncbi:MAG: hypothetical protein MN733_32880 [Nitrososphaera sp.]|nr:hypothetical protein [Nitrososphaera sp.]
MELKDRILTFRADDKLCHEYDRIKTIIGIPGDGPALRYVLKAGMQAIRLVVDKGLATVEDRTLRTILDQLTQSQKSQLLLMLRRDLGDEEVARLEALNSGLPPVCGEE